LDATDLARLIHLGGTTHPTAAITRGQTLEPKVTIVSSGSVPPVFGISAVADARNQ
jgi:hypothetical protein